MNASFKIPIPTKIEDITLVVIAQEIYKPQILVL
jgi:hypothetical protein